MFDIWKTLRDLIHLNPRKIKLVNIVFTLHCKVTVALLLACSILVTSRQYIGDPIDCISSPDVKNIADKYCWIHSTFTRGRRDKEGRWSYEAVEESEIEPGIRPEVKNDIPIYHMYYQWVWAVLFLQAAFSYLPLWLWKYLEGGRMRLLAADLNLKIITFEDNEKVDKHKAGVLDYICANSGQHCLYALQHVGCEILNLLIVLAEIILTDLFLGGEFSKYGLTAFTLSDTRPYLRRDALARVFPTVTACRIATGGVALGTVEYELLCVLPINILNEKIYVFFWFWYLTLALLSSLNLCYRIITILIPPLRRFILRRQAKQKYRLYTTKLNFNNYGDWFFLHRLGQNLNPIVFSQLLNELANKADEKGNIHEHEPLTNTIEKS